MEDFATYILNEEDVTQKMYIVYLMSKKTGIFFDKAVVLKTEIARIFMNYINADVDKNLVLTAMLLCNCKKVDNMQKIGKLETFAKEGAEYLSTLGFDKRFCKICEQLNRYSKSEPREKESDLIEIVDQFTGLILRREERPAFTPDEALIMLKERNLKNAYNRYLEDFILFVNNIENVCIKETIEVPILKKLVHVYENEKSVKSFIVEIGNKYSVIIDQLMKKMIDQVAKDTFKKIDKANAENKNRSMFSKEIAKKILNHESAYKVEN